MNNVMLLKLVGLREVILELVRLKPVLFIGCSICVVQDRLFHRNR